MQVQLAAVIKDYEAAQRRLDDLTNGLTQEQWSGSVDPTRWSAAQCIEHLNMTSQAFIPAIRDGLDKARALDGTPPERYRRDFAGWLIWRTSGVSRSFGKLRTPTAFVPERDLARERVLADFAQLQLEQIELVRSGDGLPLSKAKIASPFNARLHYSLYSAFSILPPHQHRHISQAERAVAALRRG